MQDLVVLERVDRDGHFFALAGRKELVGQNVASLAIFIGADDQPTLEFGNDPVDC
jgi:hypothetical protein